MTTLHDRLAALADDVQTAPPEPDLWQHGRRLRKRQNEHTVVARRWVTETGPNSFQEMAMYAVDIRTGDEELLAVLGDETRSPPASSTSPSSSGRHPRTLSARGRSWQSPPWCWRWAAGASSAGGAVPDRDRLEEFVVARRPAVLRTAYLLTWGR